MYTNKIVFNAPYTKLHGQKYAKLLSLDVCTFDELTPEEAIAYDTDGGDFKIEYRKTYIMLVFLGDKRIPFTTYRKFNMDTANFYHARLGQMFDIVIEDGE